MVSIQKTDSNSTTFQDFFSLFQDFLHQSSTTFTGSLTKFQDFPGLSRNCANRQK